MYICPGGVYKGAFCAVPKVLYFTWDPKSSGRKCSIDGILSPVVIPKCCILHGILGLVVESVICEMRSEV